MKRLLFILLFVALNSLVIIVAQNGEGQFLFNDFREGAVYYRDGRKYEVPLNYNVLTKQFVFLDEQKNMKAFAEPDMVTLIKIGDRTFLHDKKIIREVLQMEPPILVQYTGVIKDRGDNIGYGTTQTAAVDKYAGVYSNGLYHKFESNDVVSLSRITKRYQIVHNRKKKTFVSQSDFLKIYPQHKETLKQFIINNQLEFSDVGHVVEICNFAAALP